ncbi:MAG: FHA domain-containing protein [Blastocatellia bacterium]|nr:FHA domain-containing protein [Blastocatellia bacterium]MBN8722267.1 FHA domain-containing protein [Acidobacteriota bacterium]
MFVKLKYLNGTHPGSTKEFTQSIIKVGRAPSCDFALYDNTGRHSIASRVHAELRCEDNELFIYDLNSSNGTFVNGERIRKVALKNGDMLTFGPDGLELQVNFLISSKDETEFLASCPLFQDLPWEVLYEITRRGDIKHMPANSYLFRLGETCTTVYVIYSGLVEISTVRDSSGRLTIVGFLASGESLGESLAIIAGKHRTEARVEEAAEIFTLDAEALQELIQTIPAFALKFTSALCHKLAASEGQLQSRHSKRHLQGDLQYFDLATIVQTLNGLRETGVLMLYPKTDNDVGGSGVIGMLPFARIYFESGEARYIKLGSRGGEEGFYQLFQMPLAGTFTFLQQDLPEDMVTTDPIRMPTMNLLLEAHRLQDELESFKNKLPDLTATFRPLVEELNWSEGETGTYANQIWSLILGGSTLCEILGKTDCSNFTAYRLILEMITNNQISDEKLPADMLISTKTIRVMATHREE